MASSSPSAPRTDIVFVTYLQPPNLQDDPDLYASLRFTIGGFQATIPVLKSAAAGRDTTADLQFAADQESTAGMPPVLTPIHLQEAMARRGIRLDDITFLEADLEKVHALVASGVGLFALSTTWTFGTDAAVHVRRVARQLREIAPDVPIVVGGIGVKKAMRTRDLLLSNHFAEGDLPRLKNEYLLLDAAMDSDIDAAVVSDDAESCLADIVRCIRNGEDFRGLPGLAIPEKSGYRFTAPVDAEPDLDAETVDWRHQLHRLEYHAAPIRTATGCPFKCAFCDFFTLFRLRARSTESLMAELRTLAAAKAAPRQVFFADDNVAISKKRLLEITRAMIREDLKLSWRAFIRADSIDEETAEHMQRSGCRECLIGVESGDPDMLKAMNKRLDPERALNAVRLLDRMGINTLSTFVIGYPGESAKSIGRTTEFISSLPSGEGARAIHRFQLFRFYVLSLCPAAGREKREEYGLRGIGDEWEHSTMSAAEAKDAMRDIFASVKGPTILYLESLPPEWRVDDTRRALTERDDAMRRRLAGLPDDTASLLEAVRGAERRFDS